MHPFLKNQVLVFNHIPLEAGAYFLIGCVFIKALLRDLHVGIQMNHMYIIIYTHIYIYIYLYKLIYHIMQSEMLMTLKASDAMAVVQ